MKLEIGNFPVREIRFGPKTSYADGLLTINKDEAIAKVREDEHITDADLKIVNPGDMARLVPVKDALEMRCRIEGCKGLYPGVTAPIESAAWGRINTLKGASLLVVGKHWGSFQDGVIDMGLYLLMDPGQHTEFNLKGFIWIFISSVTYGVYLVMIKVSKTLQAIPDTQSLLVQLLSGSFVFIAASLCGDGLVFPATFFEWGNLAALALFPTVLSLLLTIQAIKIIGPTPTALFGALEPFTAVVLSVVVLGETITLRESIGGILIVCATVLVMFGDRHKYVA